MMKRDEEKLVDRNFFCWILGLVEGIDFWDMGFDCVLWEDEGKI